MYVHNKCIDYDRQIDHKLAGMNRLATANISGFHPGLHAYIVITFTPVNKFLLLPHNMS